MDAIKELKKMIEGNDEKCKGLVFKGYSNIFYDPKTQRIEKKEGIKLLKKRSCNWEECDKEDNVCDWLLLEEMQDAIENESLIFPEKIKDGSLYGIKITNIQTDWETGCDDGYDIEIYEIKEEK